MRLLFVLAAVTFLGAGLARAASIYDFTLDSIDGKAVPLAGYKGKVALVVNVASRCGFTPQYTGLEATYRKYKDRGLVVLGFPANNFREQEPGTNAEIQEFCKRTYDVTFPLFSKISVKGDDQAPLYRYLTGETGGDIEWNFTKFVIGRDGRIVARFPSKVTPDSPEVTAAIEKALAQ
jgi:glutathione peroxidase